MQMFGGHSSPFGPMGRFPFTTGLGSMMGGYPQPGFPSPLDMGMGMDVGMGMGIGPGMGLGSGMGLPGRRPAIECSPMGYQSSPSFSFGAQMPRVHPTFSHRHRGYSSWPGRNYGPFTSSFLDGDDSDDDDDYDTPSRYRPPRRRRSGLRHYQQPRYGRYSMARSFDDYNQFHDGYDDFDDDNEQDLDSFFPSRRWHGY